MIGSTRGNLAVSVDIALSLGSSASSSSHHDLLQERRDTGTVSRDLRLVLSLILRPLGLLTH
jgi:hypothetical protein